MRTKVLAVLGAFMLRCTALAQTTPAGPAGATPETIQLLGPGLTLTFEQRSQRVLLSSLQSDGVPLLYADRGRTAPGAGPIGNPLAVVVNSGKFNGIYGANTFRVLKVVRGQNTLLVYQEQETMPLQMVYQVSVEGHVTTWTGQALWNGEEPIEADLYFPLLSRARFAGAGQQDRAIVPQTDGTTLAPLETQNFTRTYMGSLAAPVFLLEGGGRGLAVVDDNRTDYAAEPGGSSRRNYVIANTFPVPKGQTASGASAGEQGPYFGICHTRWFHGIGEYGGEAAYTQGGSSRGGAARAPIRKLGDAVDLGPVRVYAYTGSWKTGAAWLRTQRRDLPIRVSPAQWYQKTTFLSEENADNMLARGETFYDLRKVLAERQQLGSDFFHLYAFHDPELLGDPRNWVNRGDYSLAAQNLGGFEAARKGIETVHEANGHIIYYVEGLIMWKRSRIGRAEGKHWALMEPDGAYTEHYKGFWHMCPAYPEWQDWIAKTCAEIVKSTGVDGFFIDSTTATYNHRCFNPAHHHPHPDVWNWGVRQTARRIREEVDKVNPNTILITEAVGDMVREYTDGFLAHGHDWAGGNLSEPLVRFIYPDLRVFESSRCSPSKPEPPQREQVWNSVNGLRIYAHNPNRQEMAPYSIKTRHYYDAFPEIPNNRIALEDVKCEHCIAQLFEAPYPILTVGNLTDKDITATVTLAPPAGILFDRVTSAKIPVVNGKVTLPLTGWDFMAFEVRP
ncbi:MAG: DUF6259 domain-containing protein [Verrucomicrobiota bacterium]